MTITERVERFGRAHPRIAKFQLPDSRGVAVMFAWGFAGVLVLVAATSIVEFLPVHWDAPPALAKLTPEMIVTGTALVSGVLGGLVNLAARLFGRN